LFCFVLQKLSKSIETELKSANAALSHMERDDDFRVYEDGDESIYSADYDAESRHASRSHQREEDPEAVVLGEVRASDEEDYDIVEENYQNNNLRSSGVIKPSNDATLALMSEPPAAAPLNRETERYEKVPTSKSSMHDRRQSRDAKLDTLVEQVQQLQIAMQPKLQPIQPMAVPVYGMQPNFAPPFQQPGFHGQPVQNVFPSNAYNYYSTPFPNPQLYGQPVLASSHQLQPAPFR
jgi:hypothetical protein